MAACPMPKAAHIDIHEQCARVWRSLEKTEKFVAEQKQRMEEDANCSRPLTHWQIGQFVASGSAAGVTLVGAGIAVAKLFLS